jgi:hypothetical protein
MKNYDMKPIENLMSESIEKLTELIDKKHKNNCGNCGQEFDMRDLSQVFAHEDCNGIPVDYETTEQIPHSGSKRIDEEITWSNANWWNLPLK